MRVPVSSHADTKVLSWVFRGIYWRRSVGNLCGKYRQTRRKLERNARRRAERSRRVGRSDHEHRVPIGVEAVSLPHRLTVSREHVIAPRERADEHEETRAREMEVGDERGHGAEFERREDEEAGLTPAAVVGPVFECPRLEAPDRSRPHRDDTGGIRTNRG